METYLREGLICIIKRGLGDLGLTVVDSKITRLTLSELIQIANQLNEIKE